MARARNLKPSFFTNEILGTYDPIISLLFAGLWCLADRDGRLEDRPLRIKGELFPYRDSLDINGYLTVLERDGFIRRYSVGNGKYIQVLNFAKHQTPHHTEKGKNFPEYVEEKQEDECKETLTPLNNGENQVLTRSDSLIPDSLIPDSPNQKDMSGEPDESLAADAPEVAVFDHWRSVMKHPNAKLDDKRKKIIRARLKDGYSAGDLKDAITGCSLTPFNMGLNDTKTIYDGLDLICRDASHVDRFIRNKHSPPRSQQGARHSGFENRNYQAGATQDGGF